MNQDHFAYERCAERTLYAGKEFQCTDSGAHDGEHHTALDETTTIQWSVADCGVAHPGIGGAARCHHKQNHGGEHVAVLRWPNEGAAFRAAQREAMRHEEEGRR